VSLLLKCVCVQGEKSENFHKELNEIFVTETAAMAAQENTEITTKFSTLNVNAVEFVPSFNYSSAVAAAAAAVVTTAPPTSQQQQPPVDNIVAPGTESGSGSVPVSGSATPATTPDSTGSAGSTNALNAAGGGGGEPGTGALSSAAASNSASPAQGSPVTTPSTAAAAAPIENINAADKITTANNGKYKNGRLHIHVHIYDLCACVCGGSLENVGRIELLLCCCHCDVTCLATHI